MNEDLEEMRKLFPALATELKEFRRKASFQRGGFHLPADYYDNDAYLSD